MIIDETNYREGNLAMASALLLYYQLAAEGRFSHDETVYVDRKFFDGFHFLDVQVHPDCEVDIDQTLLREAAVVFLLCELNDMITEHEDSFRSTELVQKFVAAYEDGKLDAIPETAEVFALLEVPEQDFDYLRYHQVLATILDGYVLRTFRRLCA